MPIILILILAVLIAQVGFWDAMGAVLGAFAMVALFVILFVAAIAIAAMLFLRRFR